MADSSPSSLIVESFSTPTITVPLTTIFTPPPQCSTAWTYEAQFYNSVAGGLLIQNCLDVDINTECFPSSFMNAGRVPTPMVYSPGACPSGYTTPAVFQNAGTTTAVCCQLGFEYTTTFSTVNFFGSSSVLYEGCVSTYAGSSSPTTVPARVNDSDLTTTAVSGQITMWGQPITVEYEASDLSLFTTSTSSSTTSTSSSSTGTSSSTSSATQAPGTTSGPTIIATSTSNGLSSGAIAGIVVAALVIAILLAIIAFLLLRRKRRAQAEPNYQGVPTQNPGTSNQPYQPYQPEPMVQRSPVEAPGDSQRPGELPGEFYSPGKNRISGRMIGELPG